MTKTFAWTCGECGDQCISGLDPGPRPVCWRCQASDDEWTRPHDD